MAAPEFQNAAQRFSAAANVVAAVGVAGAIARNAVVAKAGQR